MEIAPIFEQLTKRDRITFSKETLNTFCQKWQITDVWLFGSMLHDNFRQDKSELDLLVTFAPDAPWSLLDLVAMEQEFTALAGQDVDLSEKRGIENSRNPIRKAEILGSAKGLCSQTPIYEFA